MFARFRARLKGWKTIIWNGVVALTPLVLVSLDKLQALDLTQYMSAPLAVLAGFIIGGVGMALRVVTTGPVGSKGDETPAADVKAGD